MRPCEHFHHEKVFIGKVTQLTPQTRKFGKVEWAERYAMTFAVEETLRGTHSSQVVVHTGSGGGDCGMPLEPGRRLIIFAYRNDDGRLWTGICSGNVGLSTDDEEARREIAVYRSIVTPGVGNVFGTVIRYAHFWRGDDVETGEGMAMSGIVVTAAGPAGEFKTTTDVLGTFEFPRLPNGKYKIVPQMAKGLDYSRKYEENYVAEVSDGACKAVNFALMPVTRIQGKVIPPSGMDLDSTEVAAVPITLRKVNQFSGKWDFTDDDGKFNLWPLPPGDYLVGVNITRSPKPDSPFPPTYLPGVTDKSKATVVQLKEGEIRSVELHLPEIAQPRTVHFSAVDMSGKPIRRLYIQREDLRHPGDASSYENVDLDPQGRGRVVVYAGYSYHLHSQSGGECSRPVFIPPGSNPITVKFEMVEKDSYCDLEEIDKLHKPR